MQFAPAVHPTLIRLADELDDGNDVIAAIWRELGHRARALGLLQPSYETVRRRVHAQRAWRRLQEVRLKRAAILVAEFLLKPRNRQAILLDARDEAEIERRRRAARSRASASAARSPSGTASRHDEP
jgi:predicted DCC family thiol-disulfide oxidoreductase YuxK